MIDQSTNPVEWALLVSELDEAREHLDDLTKELAASGAVDESVFSVRLGHVFAHMNRVWNCRNLGREISEEEWAEYSKFPTDIELCG